MSFINVIKGELNHSSAAFQRPQHPVCNCSPGKRQQRWHGYDTASHKSVTAVTKHVTARPETALLKRGIGQFVTGKVGKGITGKVGNGTLSRFLSLLVPVDEFYDRHSWRFCNNDVALNKCWRLADDPLGEVKVTGLP